MELGAVFPTVEIGDDPAAIRDWAQAAEGLGYSFLVAFDHVLGAVHENRTPPLTGPYTQHHPFHEPFVLFGFLAAATTTIELETGIIILPQRQAALVAKQAAEVDVLSGGRLRLGLGVGWNPVEYEALGMSWDDRGARYDEQIEVMRRLWSEEVVDFDGRYHRVDRAGIAPRPKRRIPIWFGGFSAPALRRAARIGDGFYFANAGKQTVDTLAKLRSFVAAEGRDPAAFPTEFGALYSAGPARWERAFNRATENGVTHFSVNTMTATNAWAGIEGGEPLTTPRAHIDALETFMKAVGG